MFNRRSIIVTVVALVLLTLPGAILAQNDFQGLVKDTYAVTTANGDVDALAVVKCYQVGGTGPYFIELLGSYANNTADTVVIETTVTFNEDGPLFDQTGSVSSGGTFANSQFFLGIDSITDVTLLTEVFVGGASVGSASSIEFDAQCTPTAVSLNSTFATTGGSNWVIVAAFLLLALATAVVWRRRQA